MNSKLKNDSTDYLFKAILSLENEEDCYRFFEDLCTSAELKAMSQRLVVAKMLTEKKVYTEIVKETGASTATISRVKERCLITIHMATLLYSTGLKTEKKSNAELFVVCPIL